MKIFVGKTNMNMLCDEVNENNTFGKYLFRNSHHTIHFLKL